MNDYSICFDESLYADSEPAAKNITGHFNRANYEQNKQFSSISRLK